MEYLGRPKASIMAYLRLTCYRAFLGMKAFSCYNYVPTLLVVTQSYRAAKKHYTSSRWPNIEQVTREKLSCTY